MGQRIGQKSHWEDEREVGRSQRKQKGGGWNTTVQGPCHLRDSWNNLGGLWGSLASSPLSFLHSFRGLNFPPPWISHTFAIYTVRDGKLWENKTNLEGTSYITLFNLILQMRKPRLRGKWLAQGHTVNWISKPESEEPQVLCPAAPVLGSWSSSRPEHRFLLCGS
jgi:hypothetical protein